jgi:lipopolysaccharide transport system permease protein
VYFPRLMMPAASAASGLIDFAASLAVFFVVLRYYDMPMRWQMLAVPLFLGLTLTFALSAGLWLATLAVKYRDVSFAIAFLLQGMMYVSPVIYPASLVPPAARFLYDLNPLSSVIQGFRWALIGSAPPTGQSLGLSCAVVATCLISGAYVFRRTERTIVDHL